MVRVVVVQAVRMVDNRLHSISGPSRRWLRQRGLEWFAEGDNSDYFAEDLLLIKAKEEEAWAQAANTCFQALLETTQRAVRENRWDELGIPSNAQQLIQHSVRHELDDFLIGRFDFAGGLGNYPIKMLEFNADTCSLMPETAHIQHHTWQNGKNLPGKGPSGDLVMAIGQRLLKIMQQHQHFEQNLLVSSLGYIEDQLNCNIVVEAARAAGVREVYYADLEKVIFDPETGVFLEAGKGDYIPIDFWYKMVPWDFIAFQEPELMQILSTMITEQRVKVLNPAWSMVMQSKGLLSLLSERYRYEANLLKASFDKSVFLDGRFVSKPRFGRTGENIAIFDGNHYPIASTDGDFHDHRPIYQALAQFETDAEGHRYQASTYFTDTACGLAFRRQDDLIIDDDAEYVVHSITP